jgi:glycosyltransferase 2 family protein
VSSGSASIWHEFKRWFPGFFISVITLVVLFRIAPLHDVVKAFSTIKLSHIIVGMFLTIASLLTRAVAWRILLQKQASLSETFFGINVGYLINNIFPLRAGELARAYVVGLSSGLGSIYVFSTIVIERAFDVALSAGLLLATLPLALEIAWAKPIALTTFVIVMLGLFLLYLVARNSELIKKWVNRFGNRSEYLKQTILPRIDSLLDGFSIMTDLRQFFLSVFWIVITWVIWILLYYVVLLSIAPDAPLWWAAFADGVLAMGIALPSAPGALGILEAAIVGALGILGIDPSTAMAYAITMRIMQFTVTGILGLIGIAKAGSTIGGIFSAIRKQKTADSSS